MSLKASLDKLTTAGFDRREAQVSMMETILDAMKKKQFALIEGGTGIGKTFGYLIPALLRGEKKKIVIATATINLQAQLASKDIPRLLEALDIPKRVAVAKGRRRYVCLSRLENALEGNAQSLSLFGIEDAPSSDDDTLFGQLMSDFTCKDWDGDLDTLDMALDEHQFNKLTTDAAGCAGKRCSLFNKCPYFQAKKDLYYADIIVTNHNLLLSDMSAGSGVLLPKGDQCIYIIDEAHHFEHKAIEHFSGHCHLGVQKTMLAALGKAIIAWQTPLQIPADQAQKAIELATTLSEALEAFHQFVGANYSRHAGEEYWMMTHLDDTIKQIITPILSPLASMLATVSTWRKQLNDTHTPDSLPDFEPVMTSLGSYIARLDSISRTLYLFTQTTQDTDPPIARWFSPAEHDGAYICHASASAANTILPTQVWDHMPNGAVLCSATLRALGSFDDIITRTGLSFYKNVITAQFESPFNYSQSKLVIPDLPASPEKDRHAHTEAVTEYLGTQLLKEQNGVLVLFTSRAMLETVFENLDISVRRKILKQGRTAKHKLLDKHRKCIDAGKPSFLFGLQSFAEGVDLPGNYCTHVMIAKLPFSVPTSPTQKAKSDWLEAQGQNPFMTHSLPQASLKLTQYVGRLVRTEQDSGTVTILDPRLKTKFYGKALIKNLPGFTQT
jgi:ATP-dependent DNA helicase DinG